MKFLMTADCVSESVTIWGVEYEMNKGNVATIVVLIDLIISYSVWFALISLKPFQKATARDVNGETIKAKDFTVVIEAPPHLDNIEDLKAIYWAWAKQVLQKEKSKYWDMSSKDVD